MSNPKKIEKKINLFFNKENKIFVTLPFVFPKISPNACLEKRTLRDEKCTDKKIAINKKNKKNIDEIERFIKKFNKNNKLKLNVLKIDDVYCSKIGKSNFKKICNFKKNNKVYFGDVAGHLSKFESLEVGRYILSEFKKIL